MKPYLSAPEFDLWHGDCIEVMRGLPADSVDSVVTDPPYGLEFMGKDWDAPWKASGDVIADPSSVGGFQDGHGGNPFSRSRIRFGTGDGFQQWCEQWATECFRVLKPGGHLLAFGGTRTWHRLACAIEDAGFDIRDSIAWMYGSGFPKSLDVSKAIDRKRDDTQDTHRVVRWLEDRRQESGVTRAQVEHHFGTQNIGQSLFTITSGSSSRVAAWDQWLELKSLIGFGDEMDDEVWRLNGRKGQPGEAWAEREVLGQRVAQVHGGTWADNNAPGLYSVGEKLIIDTAPATDLARQWQGWGTALKPAFEPIVVARKPLIGTVAANVLAHGTGALNVDGCRIAGEVPTVPQPAFGVANGVTDFGSGVGRNGEMSQASGRWPANVILDESQAAELDRQSGNRPGMSTQRDLTARDSGSEGWGSFGKLQPGVREGYGDTGGASRFFYTAKANSSERPNVDGSAHPTVKPLDLMRYLVRLVTPPGGVVLEPFGGSGTTIEACVIEGFRCIAIELTEEYLTLIAQRLTKPIQVALL